ncbi:MAG: TusE/DsrC/DsvC family sulfur relay protein [Luminiphilus sp.]|jgi:tRNA 2-thiouridine synthesizing protein E|nr:TusE/DsrC/DsvC family sulfur relay protein [Luminiphilus sp.]
MLTDDGLTALCDDNGFLRTGETWTVEVALMFAKREDIELEAPHWEIITLLHDFYTNYGDSPANRALVNFVRQHLGPDKGNSLYLMGLFPGSPARVGSRIAGLPKPKNCL